MMLSKDYGPAVLAARVACGYSRSFVAGVIGVSTDYLGKIERGDRTPAIGVRRKIFDVLPVPYKLEGPVAVTAEGEAAIAKFRCVAGRRRRVAA